MSMPNGYRANSTASVAETLTVMAIVLSGVAIAVVWFYLRW
jgi:hypothetical protein